MKVQRRVYTAEEEASPKPVREPAFIGFLGSMARDALFVGSVSSTGFSAGLGAFNACSRRATAESPNSATELLVGAAGAFSSLVVASAARNALVGLKHR